MTKRRGENWRGRRKCDIDRDVNAERVKFRFNRLLTFNILIWEFSQAANTSSASSTSRNQIFAICKKVSCLPSNNVRIRMQFVCNIVRERVYSLSRPRMLFTQCSCKSEPYTRAQSWSRNHIQRSDNRSVRIYIVPFPPSHLHPLSLLSSKTSDLPVFSTPSRPTAGSAASC